VRVGAAVHAALAVPAAVVAERGGFGGESWLFRYTTIPVMRAPTIAAMMAPIAVILAALMVTPVAFLALRRGLGGRATGTY